MRPAEESTVTIAQLMDSGRHEEALSTLEAVAKSGTLSLQQILLQAQVLLALDRASDAMELLEAVSIRHPDNVEIQTWLARACLAAKYYFDAAESFRSALTVAPETPELHAGYGAALFAMGQHTEAQHHFASAGTLLGRTISSTVVKRTDVGSWCNQHGATFMESRAPEKIRWPTPKVIPTRCQAHWENPRYPVPAAFLARIPDALVIPERFFVVATDRALFVDGLVTSPDSVMYKKKEAIPYADSSGVALLELPEHHKRIESTCVLLGGSANHFHFVIEGLTRLWYFDQYPQLRDLPVIITKGLADSQKEMLRLMGVSDSRFVELASDTALSCADLWMPSLLHHGYGIPADAVHFLRERLSPVLNAKRRGRRLYFSRNRLGRRTITNEDDIWPELQKHGFDRIYPEDLSFSDQANLFANASVVIAAEGSVLPNLIFCQPRTLIGCIYTERVYVPHYYFIAAALGLEFVLLSGEPDFASHPNINHRNLYLNPDYLREFLQSI